MQPPLTRQDASRDLLRTTQESSTGKVEPPSLTRQDASRDLLRTTKEISTAAVLIPIGGVLGAERHTQLHDASLRGDVESVKRLIASQRHTASERGVAGWTPLHFAARYGAEEVVLHLLTKDLNADLEAKTLNLDTPLHLAADAGHAKIVRLLLNAKANPGARDSRNRTPHERCSSAEVQGLLAANSQSAGGPKQSIAPTVPALQAQLNEVTSKLEQLAARNAALEQHAAEASKLVAQARADVAFNAPLKALVLTSAAFADASFPALPQVASVGMLESTLRSSGYQEANIVASARDASQADMLQAVAKMADMCPASSTLLIYIGSHVHFDALTKQSFLVANDTSRTQISTTAIPLKTLALEIARIPAKRKVMMLDIMRHHLSGEGPPMMGMRDKALQEDSQQLLGLRDKALQDFADQLREVVFCTSCRTDQTAHVDASGESLFVSAVVEAISGKFGGDRFKSEARVQVLSKTSSKEAQVTASALLEYVSLAVTSQQPSQKPLHLNGDLLSRDFVVSFL